MLPRLESTERTVKRTYVFDNPPTVKRIGSGYKWPEVKLTKIVTTETTFDDGEVLVSQKEYGRPIMRNGDLRREEWIVIGASELDRVLG